MAVVEYEKKGKIAYIMLNRPERRNALSPEMAEELRKVWLDFKEDNNLWVAILHGAGTCFCAGADLSGGKPAKSAFAGSIPGATGYTANPAACKVWKPIIGAFHGYVVGAGLWLAFGCDLRIAADDVSLMLPEPKRGMATIYAAHFAQVVPMAIAAELLYTGGAITAQRAYEVGLLNKVVPADRLLDEARAWAERICENAPLAVRGMKEMLLRGAGLPFEAQLALGEHIYEPIRNSEDYLEGRNSFVEKRKPVWKAK